MAHLSLSLTAAAPNRRKDEAQQLRLELRDLNAQIKAITIQLGPKLKKLETLKGRRSSLEFRLKHLTATR